MAKRKPKQDAANFTKASQFRLSVQVLDDLDFIRERQGVPTRTDVVRLLIFDRAKKLRDKKEAAK